ncbi:MAG: radical SAM protein [Candidatus Fermentibacteria bacterium]|nr:radical SAM protein [Candidatus Fermentibacteria bacterium]
MIVKELKVNSILTHSHISVIDLYFNPYIGCSHSCIYCCVEYMKSFSGHTEDSWGSFVDVKSNTLELLRKEINKGTNKNILIGSLTDAYQPVEKKYRLTRQSLKILSEKNISTYILTKSDLITRDLDILSKMPSAKVGMSIAFADDVLRKSFEPFTSSTSKRLNTLKLLRENGCETYAFIGPIIPGLTDLKKIFKELAKAGISFAMGKMLDINRAFSHDLIRSLENIVNKQESRKIISLVHNAEYITETQMEFQKLCDYYEIENHGFFNPYSHALSNH